MRIWLANQTFNAMCEEAIARHPLESGGVLLGWRTGKDRVVIIVLGPGPKALPDNAGIKKGFTLCCLSEPFPVFGSTHLEGGLSRSQVTLGAADHPGYLFCHVVAEGFLHERLKILEAGGGSRRHDDRAVWKIAEISDWQGWLKPCKSNRVPACGLGAAATWTQSSLPRRWAPTRIDRARGCAPAKVENR